jgi:hypothetical protein
MYLKPPPTAAPVPGSAVPRLKPAKNPQAGFEEGVDGKGGTLGDAQLWGLMRLGPRPTGPRWDRQGFCEAKADDRADAGSIDGR